MAQWTDAQKQAIYEPSGQGNILVSAAAGSGKTAVLVERIVNMITRDENPVPIDKLLIVTFTEAAASEMRERIINRINEIYVESVKSGDTDKSRYLKDQMQLTVGADINTIDAFCLRVVKNNFHILGIDPNFNIMDKIEGEILMDDTLSDIFLQLYSSEIPEDKKRFTRLVSTYASNRDDEGLKSIIRKIYNFIQAFADPEKWLDEKAAMYCEDMTESIWLRDIIMGQKKSFIVRRNKRVWNDMLTRMLRRAEKAANVDLQSTPITIDNPIAIAHWGKLWANVYMCKKATETLEAATTWEDFESLYVNYIEKKSYLGTAINKFPKNITVTEKIWNNYYIKYDDLRNFLRDECMKLIAFDKDKFNEYVHSKELKQTIDDLVWLTKIFSEEYSNNKATKNEKSFSDVEHLAYRLFADNVNIRNEYAEKYDEILIDEFQDTNGLQDAIFASISRNEQNQFMVGDLKQSIYRFRGGDPTIFKKKSQRYARINSKGTRIILTQNFRSRMNVLNSINNIFGAVMSDDVGDVVYNDDESLQRDAERECYIDGENLLSPANTQIGYNSDLYRIAVIKDNNELDDDVTAERAEYAFIADKIHELVESHFKVYTKDGKYRDIEYRDIVVLMRSVKNGGETLHDLLETRNIPSFVQKEEYFERREIKLMLALISVINNHMQDIPLISVMRSPIGGFTETELAKIKLDYNGSSFYKAVKSYKLGCDNISDEENSLRNKCRRFTENLDRWRDYVKIKSIASFIWTLYEETGFYDFMGALEGGDEAQANLKLLYQRAEKYESSGFKGIFNFIRYIERLENRNEDISGAHLVNESHNVVRIMTIHKSKGLEFPVVFLARTTKKMLATRPMGENRILLHKDLGIGIDYYNYDKMYYKKLLFTEYIKDANAKEYLSEEMRLMYVAMTRAKEKLIVTSSTAYKDHDTYQEQLNLWADKYKGRRLSTRVAETAKSYSDWIIPAVESNSAYWNCFDIEISSLSCEQEETPPKEDIVIENIDKLRENIQKILEFKYEYPESGAIPAKTSVTAIKEMEDYEHPREDDPVYMVQKPQFMRSASLGAQIGTAHHQVMAFINIDKFRAANEYDYEKLVKEEILRITNDGQLERDIINDKEISDLICQNVCSFFKSDMGKKVMNAKNIYRERPFEIEISAHEYDCNLDNKYKDEYVIVQGIIDLYFEDNDGNITLVDYKTDRCKTKQEQIAIAEHYQKQLELYGQAMEKILKKSVKDKYLYLFSAQSVIKLD